MHPECSCRAVSSQSIAHRHQLFHTSTRPSLAPDASPTYGRSAHRLSSAYRTIRAAPAAVDESAVGVADDTGNESAPIHLAQCRFPRLAISNAEMLIFFSKKICGSNFIKRHSETVMVCNYQNVDCLLRKKLLCHLLQFLAHFCSLWRWTQPQS